MSSQEINALSNSEKIALVEEIWKSLEKDAIHLTDQQQRVLEERLTRYERGGTKLSAWTDVKRRIRKK